ncbi:hypothetical protein K439DRAFT_586493 [Ramaria rubella]|nr:hypothetical protein K439DRAFT_586493 [Ramaria rubella]
MLGFVAMERDRLSQIIQDFASLFLHMPQSVQVTVAVTVRNAIFAWFEHIPREFAMLAQDSGRHHGLRNSNPTLRVDGAERLFDAMTALARDGLGSGNSTHVASVRALLWTAIGALFCICPERVHAAATGKTNSFLQQLSRFASTSGLNRDTAIRVYVDICRAAFFLPPECDECALKAIAQDVGEELASLLERDPPYNSGHFIDTNLYTDGLVAMFRFSPKRLEPLIQAWLAPHRSEAVKLCVVRMAMTLIVEAPAFPWQPDLVPLVRTCVPRVYHILKALMQGVDEPTDAEVELEPMSLAHPGPERADMRRNLLLSIQGLLRLDVALFLEGFTSADLLEFNQLVMHVMKPPRDHGVLMSTFTMYAIWMRRARAVQKAEPLHDKAVGYMRVSVLPMLLACAQEVAYVWQNLENILCLHAVYNILRILAEHDEDGKDTSWKYSEARLPALTMTSVALIIAYQSSNKDISSTSSKSFGMLAKVLQITSGTPPPYVPRELTHLWAPVLSLLSEMKLPVAGQELLQKRIREELTVTSFPCITNVVGWMECHWRFTALVPLVDDPHGRAEPPVDIEVGPITFKDRQFEWRARTLALVKTGNVLTDDVNPIYFNILGSNIPQRLPIHREPYKEIINEHIKELVALLAGETLYVRETVKQALGSELHLALVPVLFEHMTTVVSDLPQEVGSSLARRPAIFVENCIAVISNTVARVETNENSFPKYEVGTLMLLLARFLDRPPTSASELRSMAQFCDILRLILSYHDIFLIRKGSRIRQHLFDIIMNWASEFPPAYTLSLRSCQAAALRTASHLAENLIVQPLEVAPGLDSKNVASRLFHRYLTIFIKGLDLDKTSIQSEEHMTQSGRTSAPNESDIYQSIISGVAHLVNANIVFGFKQCISYGYDDDPHRRAIFMEVFSRVLKQGTRLGARSKSRFGRKNSQLCELLRHSGAEIDSLVTVLLNVFDTRRAMLTLLRRLISHEVREATTPAGLFRANNLCNRLLSAFANQHGYWYLRSIIKPLVDKIRDLYTVTNFELDPKKLHPSDNLDENYVLVSELAQSIINDILASTLELPSILVDICHHISITVNQVWPDSRSSAVGGFLFLRFICPAIVSPASIDIEVPGQADQNDSNSRRCLVIIAKILQNLSNNIKFGKEAHMIFLNPLLEYNVFSVCRFLTEPFNNPSSDYETDEWLGFSCDDADTMILRYFFQKHRDSIGSCLLDEVSDDSSATPRTRNSTWSLLCNILTDLGPSVDAPIPAVAPAAANFPFRNFMSQNARRNTEPVRDIFYACEDRPDVFVFQMQAINVEIVDLELLLYHIYQLSLDYLSSLKDCVWVLDCTGCTTVSELLLDWLQRLIALMPSDMLQKIQTTYILNTNALAQSFFRKFFCLTSGSHFFRKFCPVASVSELFRHILHSETIAKSPAGLLETEQFQTFENVYQRYVPNARTAVTLEVRESHLRITSLKPQALTPEFLCRIVEVVPLHEVDDVYRVVSGDFTELVIVRKQQRVAIHFFFQSRDLIVEAIKAAKLRAGSSGLHPSHQVGGLSDITVTLLIIGLINTCHEMEWPRGAAITLLSAICSYLKYEDVAAILPNRCTSTILNPSVALVQFNVQVAALLPHLTLDFLVGLRLGFNKASLTQQMACLAYLPPWIRNLSLFLTPGSGLFEPSGAEVRDAVRSLSDITLRNTELYPLAKQCVWMELSTMDDMTLDIVTDELIHMAIDSGMDFRRCELVADVVMVLSSTHVRSRIILRLRQILLENKVSTVPTNNYDDAGWSEAAVVARLALAVSHNPRVPVQNRLFLPETAHLVTMLVGAGPLAMRTSIYGLFSNMLHALLNYQEDDVAISELHDIAEEASGPATANIFGIAFNESSAEYGSTMLSPDHDGQVDVPAAVEKIALTLWRALELGARSQGLANVWRARWMSLVTTTAFQVSPYMQLRAFVVLGVLVENSLDDDLLHQILFALKIAIRQSPDPESLAVLTIIRCLRKLIPGMGHSSYLFNIFWLSVALLQMGHLPYYKESMLLVKVTLEKLEELEAFTETNVVSILLQARSSLASDISEFDEISGFAFVDELSFSLSLACLLYSAAQHQKFRPIAGEIIRAVLRVVSRHIQTGMNHPINTHEVDPSLVGFVIASLPFSTTVTSLRALLEDARVDVSIWEAEGMFNGRDHEGYECAIPFPLLGVADTSSIRLTIAFILEMVEMHNGDVPECEILYSLLTDANEYHPSLVSEAQVHHLGTCPSVDWIGERLGGAFAGQATAPILTAINQIFKSIIIFEDQWGLTGRSTTTISASTDITAYYLSLRELGMTGLLTHLRSGGIGKDPRLFATLFEALIQRMLDS